MLAINKEFGNHDIEVVALNATLLKYEIHPAAEQ